MLRSAALLIAALALAVPGIPPAARAAPLLLLPDAPGDREPVKMSAGHRCGVERWSIKTLTDPDAGIVSMRPANATVEQLGAIAVPETWNRDAPRQAAEARTYTVHATLVGAKLEGDSDYHLVLRGNTGATMIAEIPLASCAKGSRVEKQIAAVRAAFGKRFGTPARGWLKIGRMVNVTGVLFFDEPHGQTGVAPNAVELHPVLALN